jgi:hypothetical protein
VIRIREIELTERKACEMERMLCGLRVSNGHSRGSFQRGSDGSSPQEERSNESCCERASS